LSEVELCGIHVSAGEKKETFLDVTATKPPASVQIPMTIINGAKEGPTLAVIAGVHGTEYAGVEAAIRAAKEINPRTLNGTLVVVPAANWPALYTRTVGVCPLDNVELFRAFPGNPDRSITYVIASRIFNDIVLKSDFVIDLHGGEMIESKANRCCWYVETGTEDTRKASKQLAIAFGLPNILDTTMVMVGNDKWPGPSGTLLYEASSRDVPTIIGEAGGEGKIEEDSVADLRNGIQNALIHIGMVKGKRKPSRKPTELTDLTGLVADSDGIFFSKVKTAEKVRKDQLIGEVKDIRGQRVQELIAPFNGLVHAQYCAPITRKGEPTIWFVRKR
jgi:predicted deacylase